MVIIEYKSKAGKIESVLIEPDFPLCTCGGTFKVKDYKCPKCGEIHNDQDDGYEVDGIKFPQYFNESKGSTMDGNYHDWDELHKCEKCETEYWFRNGAY